MIIESVHVKNFRCVYDEKLPCEDLTAVIGPNGSGKSSFLKAVDIFYNPQAKISEDDFYDNNFFNDIVISVTYNNLSNDENLTFKEYVHEGKLTITKIIKWHNKRLVQKYHGHVLRNPDFESVRNTSSAANIKIEYNYLRGGKYGALPLYTRKDEVEKSLREWEKLNPNNCEQKLDEGQFFGFSDNFKANLGHNTRFIYIPAVHDASQESSDGSGSALSEIMDLVVRSVLEKNESYLNLQEETQKKYNTAVKSKNKELNDLQGDLSEILNIYVPEAQVKLNWTKNEVVKLPTPKAKIKLVEDDFSSLVENTGHGLQRAFIMTLFQFLASMQDNSHDNIPNSPINLIFGVEEPEIYQHPNRQRHLSRIFYELSKNGLNGSIDKVQIIYTTHSPLFVGIDRLDNVRKLHKVKENLKSPKMSKVTSTSLRHIARILGHSQAKS